MSMSSMGVGSVAHSLNQNDLSANAMYALHLAPFARSTNTADFASTATGHEEGPTAAATELPQAAARGDSGDGNTTRTAIGMPVEFFAHDFISAANSLSYDKSKHAATAAREVPRTAVADAARRSPDVDTAIGIGNVVGAIGGADSGVPAPLELLLQRRAAPRLINARLPYFVHFHKAGGTTLCHLARVLNGLTSPQRNCNLPGDGPRTLYEPLRKEYGEANAGLTCDERDRYLRKHKYQFMAIERWLDADALAAVCTPLFFYVTVVRDPVRRIESHCRYERIDPAKALSWLAATTLPTSADPSKVQLGTAAVDNFYTRSLLGRDVFHAPAGALTHAHLARAAAVLARFDVVLILEELDAGWPQLERLAGWPCVPTPEDSHRSFGKGDASIEFTPAQRATLSSANVHDVALYTFARNLSRAITAALPPPLSARKRATQPRAHCNHARPKPQRRRRRRHR